MLTMTKHGRTRQHAAFGVISVLLAGGTLVTAGSASGDPDPSVVRTDQGAVRGTVTAEARVFRGIPYAAAPTGPLRWEPPGPAAEWRGTRDATRPGPPCPGAGVRGADEDCLHVTVATPPHVSVGAGLPVVVRLPGAPPGAGDAEEAVVVTVSHRTGVLGFLAHPRLADSGNHGLQDQQAALRWIKRNATAFGGDPGDITLVGGGAATASVCAQLVSPDADYLFDRALLTGDGCGRAEPRTRAAALRDGEELARRLGCDGEGAAACLRRLTAQELLRAADGAAYGPVYGTRQLPLHPDEARRRVTLHPVQVLRAQPVHRAPGATAPGPSGA
ncbi:carboxylesterase family protein [Streptomyces sp. TRM 70351]|uniref:carboxylesterase family protein n=1 Tax=Streptomyces sp. TRM 70351 TaxID=3116552 RepID=UPI002E7BFB66|nr:carboxylesterase family protein [Streptomyces sp. TRM 70351]MEE1931492.1 carboxylesterase family protein [Streptomyces sp. TRM 70351]